MYLSTVCLGNNANRIEQQIVHLFIIVILPLFSNVITRMHVYNIKLCIFNSSLLY